MILNKDQSKAVYDAMCALNNVNARTRVEINTITVYEEITGQIFVNSFRPYNSEIYDNQHAFATAYGVI